MAKYSKEQLQRADKMHEATAASFDEKREEFLIAQNEETEAAARRLRAYKEAFAEGFVIEKFLDPALVTFIAGYSGRIVAGQPTAYNVWSEPDATHTASLQGAFANEVKVELETLLGEDEEFTHNRSSTELNISFGVPGRYTNAEIDPAVDPIMTRMAGFDTSKTHYATKLHAIEWRLPTDEEIEQYAGAAPVAAA